MKKITFVSLLALALFLGSDAVLAKANGKGAAGGQGEQIKDVQEKAKAQGKGKAESGEEKVKAKTEAAGNPNAAEKGKVAEKAKGGQQEAVKVKEQAKEKVKEAEQAAAKAKQKGKTAEEEIAKEKGKAAVDKKAAAQDKGKAAEKALGKEHQQQLAALRKQLLHDQAKHLERMARLERIRQLAGKEGDSKIIERVNKLIADEQKLYDRKHKDMLAREQKILKAGTEGLTEEAVKAAGKGAAKEKAQKAKDEAEKAKAEAEKVKEKPQEQAKEKAEKVKEKAEEAVDKAKEAAKEPNVQ